MKHVLLIGICSFICVCLFAGQSNNALTEIDFLKEYGGSTDDTYIGFSKDKDGVYANSSKLYGHLKWNVLINCENGGIIFILKEDGMNKDISLDELDYDLFEVSFTNGDNEVSSHKCQLSAVDGLTWKVLIITNSFDDFDWWWDCRSYLSSNSIVKISIKSDYSSYSLGAVDFEGVEEFFYDKSLYVMGLNLIEEGKYDSALEAFATLFEINPYGYYHYKTDSLVFECSEILGLNMVGLRGPSGGYIFYDCDADNDSGNADGLISTECGWRYLEAAPDDISYSEFGYYRPNDKYTNQTVGTDTALGTGKVNTEALVKAMGESAYTGEMDYKGSYAAKECADYSVTVDGIVYDDWFLPSRDELNLIKDNLYEKNLGTFSVGGYWSSSEYNHNHVYYLDDSDLEYRLRAASCNVRPIRAFIKCTETLNHTWDFGVETTPATCISYGITKYTCTVCGQTKTDLIKPTGNHTYVDYRCLVCEQWGKGPAGGYVFYDCDADNDSGNTDGLKSSECGWQYLEAAPEDLPEKYRFGFYRPDGETNTMVGTVERIGRGKSNTEALVSAMGDEAYISFYDDTRGTYAAFACYNYSIQSDGKTYDDWFLPSVEELNLMYMNLCKKGMVSFHSAEYWSSSETISSWAWRQDFSNGDLYNYFLRSSNFYVRPIRAFL